MSISALPTGVGSRLHHLLVVALLSAAPLAMAAELTTQTSVGAKAEYDDNLRLSPNQEDAVGSAVAEAGLDTLYRTETLDLRANIKVMSTRYNEDGYDSDDQRAALSASKQWESQSAGIDVLINRGSTLTTEFLDSGRINTTERVETYKIAPRWDWTITETSQVALSGSATQVQYGGGPYTDYRYYDATAQYIFALRENLRLFANLTWSKYESEDFEGQFPSLRLVSIPPFGSFIVDGPLFTQRYTNASEGNGATIGGEYAITENLLVSAVGGVTRTDTTYDIDDVDNGCQIAANDPNLFFDGLCYLEDDSATTTLANASLTWNGVRQRVNASYVHRTQPSSDGYLIESQQADLGWTYELTELSTVIVEGIWGKNKSLDSSATAAGADRSNRDYYYFNLRYRHKLTEEWSVSADYRYRYQEREQWQGDSAESSMVALGIEYRLPKTFW